MRLVKTDVWPRSLAIRVAVHVPGKVIVSRDVGIGRVRPRVLKVHEIRLEIHAAVVPSADLLVEPAVDMERRDGAGNGKGDVEAQGQRRGAPLLREDRL